MAPLHANFGHFFHLFSQFLDRDMVTKKYIFSNKLNHEKKPRKKMIKNTEKMSEKKRKTALV